MQKPLISICLVNFNNKNLPVKTVESILSQTYENFELILIDSYSDDFPVKKMREYKDPRIKLYKGEESENVYQNINKTISLAKGELITILHSNDFYTPNFLDEIVKAYNNYPTKKVFITGFYSYYSGENKLKSNHPFKLQGLKTKQEIFSKLLEGNNTGNSINMAFSRSCLLHAGLFQENYEYAANYEYWSKLAEATDFVYIPKVLAYCRALDFDSRDMIAKNIAALKESCEIFKHRLLKSPLLKSRSAREASYIYVGSETIKAFKLGVAKNSGQLTRQMLAVVKTNFPDLSRNFYWHFVYLISYFVEIPSDFVKNIISAIGESVLYPYKKNCEFKQRTLFEKPKQPQPSSGKCAGSCGSCKTCH